MYLNTKFCFNTNYLYFSIDGYIRALKAGCRCVEVGKLFKNFLMHIELYYQLLSLLIYEVKSLYTTVGL